MTNFMFNYGWIVVAILIVIGYLIYTYKKYGKVAMIIKAKKMALALFLLAEKDTNLNNAEKMNYAVTQFCRILPPSLQYFIKVSDVQKFLQIMYTETKLQLEK